MPIIKLEMMTFILFQPKDILKKEAIIPVN